MNIGFGLAGAGPLPSPTQLCMSLPTPLRLPPLAHLPHAPRPPADARNRVSLPFRQVPADPAPLAGVRASHTGHHLLLLFRWAGRAGELGCG